MHQIKRVLRIPKDPRTDDMVFLTEIPHDLLPRITPEEWKRVIEGLNSVMLKKERSSLWSLLKTLLIIPATLHLASYDSAVRQYLKRTNEELKNKGIYIEDPSLSGYSELEIVLIENEILNAY